MFDRKYIMMLFWPVFIEQAFAVFINFLATLMVRGVSQDAMAGVGLVGILNFLVMNAFTAVAGGVSVVVSQCIGRQDYKTAGISSSQSLVLVTYLSVSIGVLMTLTSRPLMALLFGGSEPAVLEAARIYFNYSCISMPFLALFSTLSGIIRATGNSWPPMAGSILSNIVYAAFAWLFINPMELGVHGAGLALIAARIIPAVLLSLLVWKARAGISIARLSPRLDRKILSPVLKIAVPSGVDSIIFNGGKLIVNVFLSGMGTPVLLASSIANNISSIINLPGGAVQIISVTLAGQAYGKGDMTETRRQIIWVTAASMILQTIVCVLFLPLLGPSIRLFGPDETAFREAWLSILIFVAATPFLWSASFVTPQALRAAGCPVYTMWVSIASMILLRVFGAWFFGVYLHMNLLGIWIAMILDWAGRSAFFVPRMLGYLKYIEKRNRLTPHS